MTSCTMHTDLAYAPFGETYAATGSTGVTDISFAGNNEDTTTNLYDAQFREYGIQGRWPSPDPAGVAGVNPSNPQSWNRYAYALNNPLLAVDPSGLECVWDDGSYDAWDDPDTGNSDDCSQAGGSWIDPEFFADFGLADWSGSPDAGIATLASMINSGLSLQQSGVGANGWTLVDSFTASWSAMQALQQQNYLSNYQKNFGRQTSEQRAQAIANTLPAVCGGGVFVYAGFEGNLGPVHGFAGTINEYDTRSGHTAGFLFEGGGGEGIEGGGGVIKSPGGGTSGLAYGGFGLETPVASGSGGVVGFSSGGGVYVGGSIGPYGGGAGAYLNITTAGGCKQ